MKTALTFFLILSLVFPSQAQNASHTVDSLTRKYIAKLGGIKRKQFTGMFNQRTALNLFTRIDTFKYDYVFITETWCAYDSTLKISETYVKGKYRYSGTAFINGKYISDTSALSKDEYGRVVFNQGLGKNIPCSWVADMFDSYLVNKPVMEMPYYKYTQRGEKEISEARIKSTYGINTMIDRRNNKVIVSVQYPAKRPKLTVRYSGKVFL